MNFKPWRYGACARIVLIFLLTQAPAALAESVVRAEEADVKAAFVYNFTLFVNWPQPKTTLNLCAVGHSEIGNALQNYQGRKVEGAVINVRQLHPADDIHGCDVLFLGNADHPAMDRITGLLEVSPVLTVAESGDGENSRAIITLVVYNNRISFEINQSEALRKGLFLSSKLLKLARKVY